MLSARRSLLHTEREQMLSIVCTQQNAGQLFFSQKLWALSGFFFTSSNIPMR